jgi:hypothetical protein
VDPFQQILSGSAAKIFVAGYVCIPNVSGLISNILQHHVKTTEKNMKNSGYKNA